MRLNELVKELKLVGIEKVGSWQLRNRKGITLGDPLKYFPYQTGPQTLVDCTREEDPDLTEEEVDGILRRFGLPYGPARGKKRGPSPAA